jgi:hypothetical protein
MNKQTILFITILLIVVSVFTFSSCFGDYITNHHYYSKAKSAVETPDGDYIVVGCLLHEKNSYYSSPYAGCSMGDYYEDSKIYTVKLDDNGQVLNETIFGNDNEYKSAREIIANDNGAYFLLIAERDEPIYKDQGVITYFADDMRISLYEADNRLNISKIKSFSDINFNFESDKHLTEYLNRLYIQKSEVDAGYRIYGNLARSYINFEDIIIKLDDSNEKEWQYQYDSSINDILNIATDEYIIAKGKGSGEVSKVAYNSTDEENKWTITKQTDLEKNDIVYADSIFQVDSGNLFVIMKTEAGLHTMIIDTSGNIVSEETITSFAGLDPDFEKDMLKFQENMTGNYYTIIDFVFTEINESGQMIKCESLEEDFSYQSNIYDVIETSDGGFLISASKKFDMNNRPHFYVLKLNSSLEKEWDYKYTYTPPEK